MSEFICMNEQLSFYEEPISLPKFELQLFINFYNLLLTNLF